MWRSVASAAAVAAASAAAFAAMTFASFFSSLTLQAHNLSKKRRQGSYNRKGLLIIQQRTIII
jgi:hypothetical protein